MAGVRSPPRVVRMFRNYIGMVVAQAKKAVHAPAVVTRKMVNFMFCELHLNFLKKKIRHPLLKVCLV